jgi:hypothetical protein
MDDIYRAERDFKGIPAEECEAWNEEDMNTCSCESCYWYRFDRDRNQKYFRKWNEEMEQIKAYRTQYDEEGSYARGFRKDLVHDCQIRQ